LGTFNDRYPGVRVRADTMGDQEMSDALLSGEVDVIFIDMFEGSERPFLTRELFDDELLAVLPFGHPLAEKECVTLGELAEYPFLEVSSDGLVSNLKYVSDEERNLSWKIRFSLSDDLMLMNMIKNGMGVSFVGRMLTVNYPDKVVTRPLDPRKHRTFGIGVRSEKHLSPAVSAFIDTTDEVIADALEQI
ncbi:MAG: LysR family transcriptional regulator substrate-binding protein, partial [Anaerovoracaceae bacterium]|nr:LysR family transcriptional regulator substrate-binding protein [Anaerovoracaceae bacterium]